MEYWEVYWAQGAQNIGYLFTAIEAVTWKIIVMFGVWSLWE